MDAEPEDSGHLDGIGLGTSRADAKHDQAEELSLFWRDDVCMMQQLARQWPTLPVHDVDGDASQPTVHRQGNNARDGDPHGGHRAGGPEGFRSDLDNYFRCGRVASRPRRARFGDNSQ
jgi:hypothetical protein